VNEEFGKKEIAVIDGNEGLLAAIVYYALRIKVVESYFI
jgi:hypothetical protein